MLIRDAECFGIGADKLFEIMDINDGKHCNDLVNREIRARIATFRQVHDSFFK
jgi:hypothetical protein